MTQETATFEAFPLDGLNLQDFARRMCRSQWDVWQQAEKELADVGGRVAAGGRRVINPGWLPVGRSSATSCYMDGGQSLPRQVYVAVEPERTTATVSADRALEVLRGAVCVLIKSGQFVLRGISKGGYEVIDIVPDLLIKMLWVKLKESTIGIKGARRFECVRVFPSVSQSVVSNLAPPSSGTPWIVLARLTTKEQAAHLGVVALWPTGLPSGLKSIDRDKQILDWQKANKLSVSSSSTIKRLFRKLKQPVHK